MCSYPASGTLWGSLLSPRMLLSAWLRVYLQLTIKQRWVEVSLVELDPLDFHCSSLMELLSLGHCRAEIQVVLGEASKHQEPEDCGWCMEQGSSLGSQVQT